MATLTQEMKDLVRTQQCFIASVNADGTPNVGPKRSTRVLDDEHLAFTEITGKRTWTNVLNGSKLAVAVVDREKSKGFRFVGTAEVVREGQLYDEAAAVMKSRGLPAPKGIVKIKVERIYNLGTPGAGEEIA